MTTAGMPTPGPREIREDDIRRALQKFDPLWVELPDRTGRFVQFLVERIVVCPDSVDIRLCVKDTASLVKEPQV